MASDFKKLEELGASLDPSGMIELVRSFPSHMTDAWNRGREFAQTGVEQVSVSKIVVCGMGGSAIGGDMVRSCLGGRLRVPLHVNRNYDVAASLREDALFVFSSYSGNTGETLSSYEAVRGSGAPAIAITSGGELEKRCRKDGVPVCRIPGGMPPRSAIAYSFFPLVQTFAAMGLTAVEENEFQHAQETVARLCRDYSSQGPENAAADMAYRLHGVLPFIYSCGGLFEAVARRWSCQLNENGKTLAHFATFTELNHNEIVGWAALERIRDKCLIVSLEDEEDHPLAKKQADIALEVIEPLSAGVVRVTGAAGPRMTRILTAMILGDFTSVYLAYLNGVDPTPVKNIDLLKDRLKR